MFRMKSTKYTSSLVEDVFVVLKSRDPYTAFHCKSVAELSVAVAKHLEMSEQEIHTLYDAALLHDIGKVDIPLEILNAERSLTEDERQVIEKHTEVGAARLRVLGFPDEIVEVALLHHKKLDGSGYPRTENETFADLYSKPLSTFVKIVSACDIYNAVTSKRPYRQGVFSHEDAVSIVREANVCEESIVRVIEHHCFTEHLFQHSPQCRLSKRSRSL